MKGVAIMQLTELANYLDHTLLKPNATKDQIDTAIAVAKNYQTASLCVNGGWTYYVSQALKDSPVKTTVVVGFPLGAMSTETKVFETKDAIQKGADEIDMVINIGQLLDGNVDFVRDEIKALADTCHQEGAILKVIIETSYLTDEQKVKACLLAKEAGADFVKTSTGFSEAGATLHDVALMRQAVGSEMGVKASGGIRDYDTAVAMIEAGASRLGLSGTEAILAE